MALTLLAHAWARRRSGRIHALTVDHGLRPDSADEARQVGSWLAQRGIPHTILRWRPPGQASGLQAAARDARYAMLERWCATSGVLHLLVGHHANDQAETVLMRFGAGSGALGLSGMAAVSERRDVRILRPLLHAKPNALRDYLKHRRQRWIEDPSNEDPSFTRVRIRQAIGSALGLSMDRLNETARKLGRTRATMESVVARQCASAVSIMPSGYALLDAPTFAVQPPEVRMQALAAVVRTVGGRVYSPREERLRRLDQAIQDRQVGRARTLAGTRIGPWRGRLLVSRELAAVADSLSIPRDASEIAWDGRFLAHFGHKANTGLRIGALGTAGVTAIRATGTPPNTAVPAVVWPTLPTIWRADTVLAVPHLGYGRMDDGAANGAVRMEFMPPRPVSPPEFGIV